MENSIQSTVESKDTPEHLAAEMFQANEEVQLPVPDTPERLIDETPLTVEQEEVSARPEEASSGSKREDVEPANSLSTKNKRLSRFILVLLLLTFVGVGLWQRERLLKLFSGSDTNHSSSSKVERKVLYWQDPMHPAYTSDKPGKAPDCGMDLVPVYEESMTEANLPDGAFRISPEKQQLIGVTYGEVTFKQVSRVLKAVGKLNYDETKIVRIHPKVEGWIENVFVDFVGKEVRQGQPLLSLYSPELVSTQQEYLIAMKGRNELSESPFAEAVSGADSLYEATRRRLQFWDITEEQIQALEKRGTPTKALTLYAPTNGFVVARNAYAKQRVTPETELFSIADLSTIWLVADIYQNEAPEISLGQTATFTLSYFPNQIFKGKVAYIYPQMDNETRTLKVRIDVPNPRMILKPEMYANVEIHIDYGKRLVVPQEAIMDSGSEQLVFVAHEGGYLEPRKVQLGENVDGQFIVLSGLKVAERIVTSANFLVDSESKLKSAAGGMGMPGMNHGGGAPAETRKPASPDHSEHQQDLQQTPPAKPEGHSQRQPKAQKREDHSQHQGKAARKILYWYDTMHPEVQSDKPGKCPKCGMDLVPKYTDEKPAT